MKISNSKLEQLALKYYPFAYSLLPDELMASQLISDSVTKMAIAYTYAVRDKSDNKLTSMDEIFEFDFLKNIFELSVIRTDHFRSSSQLKSFNPHCSDFSFYLMSLEERACLFLRDKLNIGFRDISYIMGLSFEEALALTHRSRGEFIEIVNGYTDENPGESYA